MKIRVLAIAAILSTLAACSAKAPPSFGEQLAEKSAATDAIARKWQAADAQRRKGLRLIEKGQNNLAEAQKDMNRANRDIEKGQQMVMEAEAGMRTAEESMRTIRAQPIDIPSTPLTLPAAGDK